MSRMIKIVLSGGLWLCAMAGAAETYTCTGTVTDAAAAPLSSVRVGLHVIRVQDARMADYEVEKLQEVVTDANGDFSLQVNITDDAAYRYGVILADKTSLALGWANWDLRSDAEVTIALSEPNTLDGTIVDEADAPVSDANVSLFYLMVPEGDRPRYITGTIAEQLFTCQTDANGRFAFKRIPSDAQAEFLVKKPGRATVTTFTPRAGNTLTYRPGQQDIRIVLPIEGIVRGKVVEKATGQGVGDIRVTLNKADRLPTGLKPVVSQDDGTFVLTGLEAGRFMLEAMFSRDTLAPWVAVPVPVDVQAGKTVEGVTMELTAGGILEVTVTASPDRRPVEKAQVMVRDMDQERWLSAVSDARGLARLRLAPGEYEINNVYKDGYTSQEQALRITVTEGQTLQQAWELGSPPTVSGVVKDPDGAALQGVSLRIMPLGNREVTSDANGLFEASWDPRRWGSEPPALCLFARHVERDLGMVIPIDEDQTDVTVQLAPAMKVIGQVVDPGGKPIPQATGYVMLRMSNWGSTVPDGRFTADAEGRFEVKSLAQDQDYTVTATADGFGKQEKQAQAADVVDRTLDLGRFELALADLSISGRVVDVNDEPVAGARIYAYGDGQPDKRDIQTDKDGQFVIDQVCAGRMRLSVNANIPGQTRMYGNVETEGGATDVTITVSPRGSSQRYIPKQPKSLVGKSLPDLAGLDDTLTTLDVQNRPVLICFWDLEQRPARRYLTLLARQADPLSRKGVAVITVQASPVDRDALNTWMQQHQVPFTSVMLQTDPEKVKFAWGVQGLPWLILTDTAHQVTAEGFRIQELQDKIPEVSVRPEETAPVVNPTP